MLTLGPQGESSTTSSFSTGYWKQPNWRVACTLNCPTVFESDQGENSMATAIHQSSKQTTDKAAIRPFQVNVPEEQLTELRRRVKATIWPERETVSDATQGVQLATIQALARYWASEYDWRKIEAKMNALPQFITEVDG